jgi:hypothetical protein
MEPRAASADAKPAETRRRAWPANLLAVFFVLAVGGVAAGLMSQQLRQERPDRAAAAPDGTSYPKIEVLAPSTEAAEQPRGQAAGGKMDDPILGLDRGDRLLVEAAGGVFVLALAVTVLRRAYPPRRLRLDSPAQWASMPWQSPGEAANPPHRQPSSSAIAAARLSAVVWGDHVARQHES